VLKSDNLHINGQVIFENNTAENDAGIHISDYSTVIFGKNSNVKFINNSGAAIFLNDHSIVLFDLNSNVTFNSNKASQVIFKSNTAENGAGIYISDYSTVVFRKMQM